MFLQMWIHWWTSLSGHWHEVNPIRKLSRRVHGCFHRGLWADCLSNTPTMSFPCYAHKDVGNESRGSGNLYLSSHLMKPIRSATSRAVWDGWWQTPAKFYHSLLKSVSIRGFQHCSALQLWMHWPQRDFKLQPIKISGEPTNMQGHGQRNY